MARFALLCVVATALFAPCLAAEVALSAGETCTLTDPNSVTIKCPQSGYFTFSTMGTGSVESVGVFCCGGSGCPVC